MAYGRSSGRVLRQACSGIASLGFGLELGFRCRVRVRVKVSFRVRVRVRVRVRTSLMEPRKKASGAPG